jgi:hypothetical protein
MLTEIMERATNVAEWLPVHHEVVVLNRKASRTGAKRRERKDHCEVSDQAI